MCKYNPIKSGSDKIDVLRICFKNIGKNVYHFVTLLGSFFNTFLHRFFHVFTDKNNAA